MGESTSPHARDSALQRNGVFYYGLVLSLLYNCHHSVILWPSLSSGRELSKFLAAWDCRLACQSELTELCRRTQQLLFLVQIGKFLHGVGTYRVGLKFPIFAVNCSRFLLLREKQRKRKKRRKKRKSEEKRPKKGNSSPTPSTPTPLRTSHAELSESLFQSRTFQTVFRPLPSTLVETEVGLGAYKESETRNHSVGDSGAEGNIVQLRCFSGGIPWPWNIGTWKSTWSIWSPER